MAYRRFRLQFLTRILLLTGTIFVFVFLLSRRSLYATIFISGLAAIIQVFSLLKFVEKTNRDFSRFLKSIQYNDFTQNFKSGMRGRSFDELNESFEQVVERFREISLQREESHRYLQTVVQHIGVGIVAFGQDGAVDIINTAAKRLFGLTHLRNIVGLGEVSPVLLEKVRGLKPGQHELFTVRIEEELLQLSLYSTELRQRNRVITLVSFQNISAELNEKEMDAWQNLIRVLTHEIKNSLAPIESLASSVEGMLLPGDRPDCEITAPCDADDVGGALQTIQRRTQGLLQFVDTYRELTHIPKPQHTTFKVSSLIGSVEKLVFPPTGERRRFGDGSEMPDTPGVAEGEIASAARRPIIFEGSTEPADLRITADRQLIEQVLINLVINAVQALENRPDGHVSVKASIDDRGRAIIHVIDNGPGITGEDIEKVFVPFYSTKKDGSGIGLSLSRQIMRVHRGELTVLSEPGVRTAFRMRF